MDTLSFTRPKQAERAPPGARTFTDGTRDRAWPAVKAVHGKYYGFTDNYGTKMVAQTMETWTEIGTELEKQRQLLRRQDGVIKDQIDEIRRLRGKLDEITTKHENLRAVRRGEVRRDIEAQAALPEAPVSTTMDENNWFIKPKGTKS